MAMRFYYIWMPATCNMTTSRTYTCKAQATHLYSEMLLLTAASTFLHIPFRSLLLLLLLCVRIHAFIHDFIFFLQLPSRLFICFCFFFCCWPFWYSCKDEWSRRSWMLQFKWIYSFGACCAFQLVAPTSPLLFYGQFLCSAHGGAFMQQVAANDNKPKAVIYSYTHTHAHAYCKS